MSNRPCALCCPHGYHNDCPRCLSTDPRDARAAEVEALKGKRGNAEYRATIARRALERIVDNGWGCFDDERIAREALAALDASGAQPPPAAGSPGKVLQERDPTALRLARAVELLQEISEDWTESGEQEHAVLLRVAEAAERMIRRGFSCGKCDQEIPGASCVCADPEDIQMPSIRSALADLRRARERKERGDGQG